MKTIRNMRELEPFGIIPLTGESDQHVYRILCDVNAKGRAILERTLDIEVKLSEPWNSNKDDPHIGSFLLPHEFVPCLSVFALLSDPHITEVWLHKDGSCSGFGVEDVDLKERLKKHHEGHLRKIFYATSSDRHRHCFTGRTR